MKRILVAILALTLIFSLAGCSGKNELVGTWEVESVFIGESSFTVEELESMGDDSVSDLKIILKDGGKAYVLENGEGDLLDWEETEGTMKIGYLEFKLENGKLCMGEDDLKILFAKVSDSQTIDGSGENTKPEKTDKDEENDKQDSSSIKDEGPKPDTSVTINPSPDKYTWYIKSYVGKNCAAVGYTSLGGDRLDKYGAGYLQLVFVTADGSYVDIESEEELKQYAITGQSLPPNTEIKYTFLKDSNGEEYSNLVDSQSFDEIVLSVCKVGETSKESPVLTQINASPDKYTQYVADYTGRNLASCGYTSLGGDLMDDYGAAYVELVIMSEDGSFIDPEDRESLKNYVVVSQSIAPNTEFSLTFLKDGEGKEYDNLVDYQDIEEIELSVRIIG